MFVVGYSAHLNTIGTILGNSYPLSPSFLILLNNRSVRQKVRNHDSICFESDDFPCFLWEGETADVNNLRKGFLRGEILIRVCTLLIGVSHTHQCFTDYAIYSAWSLCCTYGRRFRRGWLRRQNQHAVRHRSHYCVRCGGREFPSWGTSSTYPLTNVSIQARHALTADSKFVWATDGPGFSYLTFYDTIIDSVSRWSQAEQTCLIQWCNGCALPNSHHSLALPNVSSCNFSRTIRP
jgi:hypothetical protein